MQKTIQNDSPVCVRQSANLFGTKLSLCFDDVIQMSIIVLTKMKPVTALIMKAKIYILLISLCACTMPVSGQVSKDSLWQVWEDKTQADTNRLKAIHTLTLPMLYINMDSAYLLANMQIELARKAKQKKWIAKGLHNIATYYYLKGDLAESLSYYQQSLDIRKEIRDLKGEAAIYGNFSLIYRTLGNHLKDLEYQLKSLAINEKLKDTSNLTNNYNNLATIHQHHGNRTKALEYYNKAMRMYEKQGRRGDIALIYNNIGNLYRSSGEFVKALDYLNRSLEIRTAIKDRLGMAINYVSLGTVYDKMGDYPRAIENTLLSIKHFRDLGDTTNLANAYFTLGDIAIGENKYQEAVNWCEQSFKIAKASHKIRIEQAACACLHRAHKALGNIAEALYYLEEYLVLNDSLKEEDLEVELTKMEFETEMLEDSLSRADDRHMMEISHQSEIHKRSRITRIILIIALGVLGLAMVFMSRMLIFQRSSETLKKKTEELEKQQLVNEVSLLKTQVNPHFLFNSLSILSSLVRVDPDLSERFIEQLSHSYRYILEQKDHYLVTLRTELGFIESYAFLLKIRFENKFDLHIDLPDEILDKYKIAPLTLQLLVENAVKHNRMSVSEPLIVTISIEGDEMLVVKNKLQLRTTPTKSTGIGLQNIINRYALLTDRPVWAGETQDQFVIRIPLINENA